MTTQTSINERPPGAAPPPPTGKGWCEAALGSDPDDRLRPDVALLSPVLSGRRAFTRWSNAGLYGGLDRYEEALGPPEYADEYPSAHRGECDE
jgi:hypothetical protein